MRECADSKCWANITPQSKELRRGQSVSVSHPSGAFPFIFSTIGILAGCSSSQTLKKFFLIAKAEHFVKVYNLLDVSIPNVLSSPESSVNMFVKHDFVLL